MIGYRAAICRKSSIFSTRANSRRGGEKLPPFCRGAIRVAGSSGANVRATKLDYIDFTWKLVASRPVHRVLCARTVIYSLWWDPMVRQFGTSDRSEDDTALLGQKVTKHFQDQNNKSGCLRLLRIFTIA